MINLYDNESSYLPTQFRYDGYKKIKGGKGYRNGKPIGIQDVPCDAEYTLHKQFTYLGKQYNYELPYKCNGTIISLQMNTSSKGFETTSEKACDTCGKISLGSFIVIDNPYSADLNIINRWTDHTSWIKDMQKESPNTINKEGISTETETYEHITGRRLNTDDNHYYGAAGSNESIGLMSKNKGIQNSKIEDKLHEELGLTSKKQLGVRCDQWNRTSKEVIKLRENGYKDLVDIYKGELELTPGQVEEIKHLLKSRENEFNMCYKMEDIIQCICLYVKSKSYSNYRQFNAFIARYSIANPYNKTLYKLIREKLNS